MISKKHDFTISGEHNSGNMLDSGHRRLSVMEVSHENRKHRYNFLRAADRSENSWRSRQKAGEFGNHQGRGLLPSALSAALPFPSWSNKLDS